ncbi:MAG: PAS domain S-box protein [Candidatus Doudnabacteria bacterium]|nr:PAS domain S-box protein [Candidatus Doudnabacteria bacterium]
MLSEQIALLNNTTLESLAEKDRLIIVKNFTEIGLQILKADFAFAWWKSDNTKKYSLAYKTPNTPYVPNPPRKRGGNYRVQKSKKPLYISDTSQETYSKKYDISSYMKSYCIVPIFFKKHNYGNVIFCFRRKISFSTEKKTLCASIGHSLAQTITIHRLYSNLKDFKNRLDHTLDAVFIFDPVTYRIEYSNLGTVRQLGYSSKEICKKTIIDLQPNVDIAKFRKLIAPLIWKKRDSITFETTLKTSKGKNIPVELFIQLSSSLDGPRKFLSIVHNLTQRKKVEMESQKLLRQKDQFFSIASHELKTPVTTIKGFSQMLSEKLKNIKDEESRYFLGKINNQVEKIDHLINDLLDVSRIETGKLKFDTKELNLNSLVHNLVENFQYIVTSHSISFSSEGNFWIEGDNQRIEQVITNLITNAVKYSPPDSKIIINLKAVNKQACIEVEDFGFGISEHDQEKVFHRFFQSKHKNHKIYPGLGLGLYIARTIVKHHGGELSFISKKTGGTIFSINIPYTKCQLENAVS